MKKNESLSLLLAKFFWLFILPIQMNNTQRFLAQTYYTSYAIPQMDFFIYDYFPIRNTIN